MKSQSSELKRYLGVYKEKLGSRFYIILSLATLSGIAESFGILMVLPLLNSIGDTPPESVHTEQNAVFEFIASLNLGTDEILVGIIIAFLFKGVLLFVALAVNASMRAQLMREYKERLFDSFSKMSLTYYSSKDSGHFLNVINEQVNRALQAFHHLTQVSVQFITALIYICLAFFIAWRFGLMALCMGLMLSYIFKRINSYVRNLSRMSAKQNSKLSKLIIQSLAGYEYLAATGQSHKTKSGIFESIFTLTGLQKRTWVASALTQAIREPLAVLFIMVIVLIQVVYFDEPMSPIIVSIILFYRAMNSLLAMQTQWQFALEFIGSTELVNTEQESLSSNQEVFGNEMAPKFAQSIEFKKVAFTYDPKAPLIEEFSLLIKQNQVVAFVGPSGSGKSTVIKLITALVKPQSGDILVDGRKLNDLDISSWRSQLGYVSQNPVLFDDSIANNISMELGAESTDEATLERVREACKKAHIDDFIESLPEGYETDVGERGMRLSGGQRQRISIARELYRGAEVLILDEATSALDSKSERAIQESLDELKGQLTLVVIAHRLSTIKNADNIYVMDKGKLIESGSFDNLLNVDNSQFSQLVKTQQL